MDDVRCARGTGNRLAVDVRQQRNAVKAQVTGEDRHVALRVAVVHVLATHEDAAQLRAAQTHVRVAGSSHCTTSRDVEAHIRLADCLQAAAQIFNDVEEDARRIISDTALALVRHTGTLADIDVLKAHFPGAADRHAGLRQRETRGCQRACNG